MTAACVAASLTFVPSARAERGVEFLSCRVPQSETREEQCAGAADSIPNSQSAVPASNFAPGWWENRQNVRTLLRTTLHRLTGDDVVAYVGAAPRFTVLEDPLPNAYLRGGSEIVLSTGLLDVIRSESELAFVVAHELGHISQRQGGADLIMSTALIEKRADQFAEAMLVAGGYSRHGETTLLAHIDEWGRRQDLELADVFPSLGLRRS